MPLNESGAWRAGRGTACPRRLASNCVWLGVVIDEEVWCDAGLARRGPSSLVMCRRSGAPRRQQTTLGERAAASAVQESHNDSHLRWSGVGWMGGEEGVQAR